MPTHIPYNKWREDLRTVPKQEQAQWIHHTLKYKKNLHIFGRYFFPHIIKGTEDVPECHLDLLEAINSTGHSGIIFPRGHAKSTWIKLDTIHDIVYGTEPVILYIGNTLTDAGFHFEGIKTELENNDLLHAVFGDLVPPENKKDRKWTNKHFETINGVNAVARGAGKGRGVNIKNQRPTKIVCDDIEDDEEVRKAERRQKLHEWLYNVIFNSLDAERGKIKLIGTVLHQEAEILQFYNKFGGIFRKAIEDKKSIWPNYFNMEKLDQIREDSGTRSFCNPGIAPILMSDFTYKKISEIKEGDEIIGFEFGKEHRKKLVKSTVKKVMTRVAKTVEFTLSNGDYIRCTPEHRWFTGRFTEEITYHGKKYKREPYKPAKIGTKLMKVLDVDDELSVEEQKDWQYLAGMIDGEGSCKYGSIQISQCPKHNPEVYKRIMEVLDRLKIKYKITKSYTTKRAHSFVIAGGRGIKSKIIRYGNPAKKNQILKNIFDNAGVFVKEKVRVLGIKDYKKEKVYALETTTGNYIVWGYASSNSQEYMNEPTNDELANFKPAWIDDNNFTELPEMKNYKKVIFMDPQAGESATADEWCITVLQWANKDRHRYAIQQKAGRCSQTEQAKEVIKTWIEHPEAHVVGVEKVMNQTAVFQNIMSWKSGELDLGLKGKAIIHGNKLYGFDKNIPIKGTRPKAIKDKFGSDKLGRLQALEPMFERGEVHLRPEMRKTRDQILFLGLEVLEHDDRADSLMGALELSYQNLNFYKDEEIVYNKDRASTIAGNLFKKKF